MCWHPPGDLPRSQGCRTPACIPPWDHCPHSTVFPRFCLPSSTIGPASSTGHTQLSWARCQGHCHAPTAGGGAALAVRPSLSASAAVLLPSLLHSQRATRCQRLSGCLPGPFVPREAKCLCSGHSPESSFPPPGVYLTCPAASRPGHPSLCCCEWHCVFLVSACDPLAVDRLQLDLGEEA